MIRMEGGGCGGGVVGEQKDELHEHVPSSEMSLLKGGVTVLRMSMNEKTFSPLLAIIDPV